MARPFGTRGPAVSVAFAELQRVTLARDVATHATARELFRELRKVLVQASNDGLVCTPPHEIMKQVRCFQPEDALRASLSSAGLAANAYCIVGGEKNQGRDPALPHFERHDGAWFDFTLTVREASGKLEILAYDFEIRLPHGHGAPFLRFDLNLPDHTNQARDLRCHLHPGSDDILLPAPLMTPLELLNLFVHEVAPTTGRDAARTPTEFEVEWWQETLALHQK